MSLVPCPRIIASEKPGARPYRLWEARFAGRKRPLPMIFRAGTRQHAIAKAEAWWAAEQARRAEEIALAAARAEAARRRAFA